MEEELLLYSEERLQPWEMTISHVWDEHVPALVSPCKLWKEAGKKLRVDSAQILIHLELKTLGSRMSFLSRAVSSAPESPSRHRLKPLSQQQ